MNLSKYSVLILLLALFALVSVYFSTDLLDETISVDKHATNTLNLFHDVDFLYSYAIEFSHYTSENKKTIFGKEYSKITMSHGSYNKDSLKLQTFNGQVLVIKNDRIKLLNEGNAKVMASNEDGLIDSFFIEVKEIEDMLLATVKDYVEH